MSGIPDEVVAIFSDLNMTITEFMTDSDSLECPYVHHHSAVYQVTSHQMICTLSSYYRDFPVDAVHRG